MEHRTIPRPLRIGALALLCAAIATPCSFDTTPNLFFEARPDAPIDAYVDGALGILQPGYARSHLVVAYRYLSGDPPSPAQREGFRELLRHRLDEYPEGARPAEAVDEWVRLRNVVRGGTDSSTPAQSRPILDSYEFYDNCTDDAFVTASVTLANRTKTYGAAHPAVLKWLDAQDLVFANCAGPEAKIPTDDAALPALLRADRQYQIAAAHFYAQNYDDARARFQTIGRDAKSPWQKVARLVAVRSLIRAESLGVTVQEDDPLGAADRELRAILADRSMQALHDAAWDLLAVTTFRRDPQQRFREAASGLMGAETAARRVRVDLADYTILRDKEISGEDELTDWIDTFKSGNLAHALERWRATKGEPWLVAALTHVKPGDPSVDALLEGSASVAPSSPAATMVTYHRVRLLLGAERTGDARVELDRILAKDLPESARNQLLVQRRSLARTLEEYLRDVPVIPVAYGEDPADRATAAPLLPRDAAVAFDYWTDLETLGAAARSELLPAGIRLPLTRAAWTRAVLLDRVDIAATLDPAFGEDLAPLAEAWSKASEDERPFAAADLFAHAPDLEPYVEPLDFRYGNWWCTGGPPYDRGEVESTRVPEFLAREDSANLENDALFKGGSGATWILKRVLARAKSHPADPRVPESLSQAILGTRRACGDESTEALAKEAFQLLHRKYANTQWAKDTPYWYKPNS